MERKIGRKRRTERTERRREEKRKKRGNLEEGRGTTW